MSGVYSDEVGDGDELIDVALVTRAGARLLKLSIVMLRIARNA